MQCVRFLEDIIDNMYILDYYLEKKTESTYSFALSLIQKGTCFIAAKTEDGYKFYPSRFMGYKDNTMDKHLNNYYKDGKVTNPVISEILEQKPVHNPMLDKEYREYCEKLGFFAREKGNFGVERKFWEIEL